MTDTLMTDGQSTQTADTQQAADTQAPAASADQGHPAADTQQANDGKPADGQPADDGNTDDAAGKPQGAPEKYEFTPPEGSQFDDKVLGAFSDAARELNLTQEAAQKLLDKMAPAVQARNTEQLESIRQEWVNGAKADKEFGGDKLTENLNVARTALEKFGTPELRSLLNESGLGNHPEIIRAFYRAGKAISEDKFVGGKGAPAASSNDVRSLYPNSNLK